MSFSDHESGIAGYVEELEPWEYDFVVDHFQRNENFEYGEDSSEFIASYDGDRDIFWYGTKDTTSAWLRTFMLESDEVYDPVSYLESVNENRLEAVGNRARETLGV